MSTVEGWPEVPPPNHNPIIARVVGHLERCAAAMQAVDFETVSEWNVIRLESAVSKVRRQVARARE